MADFAYLVLAENAPSQHPWVVWQDGANVLLAVPGATRAPKILADDATVPLDPAAILTALRRHYPGSPGPYRIVGGIRPGEYHPRVWRSELSSAGVTSMQSLTIEMCGLSAAANSAANAASLLFDRMRDLFRVVEPDPGQFAVYGHEIRHLLILACTEVEAAWRAVLEANTSASAPGRFTTNDYVRLLAPMRLAEWRVTLRRSTSPIALAPFAAWSVSNPTQTLPWYDAYNGTKHDREAHLARATLGTVLDAMAALYILLLAQFGGLSGRVHSDFGVERQPQWPPEEAYVRDVSKALEHQSTWWRPRKLF
jgi:hypothetical protein